MLNEHPTALTPKNQDLVPDESGERDDLANQTQFLQKKATFSDKEADIISKEKEVTQDTKDLPHEEDLNATLKITPSPHKDRANRMSHATSHTQMMQQSDEREIENLVDYICWKQQRIIIYNFKYYD